MKSLFHLFIHLFLIVNIAAQVSMDSTYTAVFLEKVEETALAKEDSNLLGKIYFLQAANLKNETGNSEAVFGLFSKSLQCFEATKDSLRLYQSKRNIANYYLNAELKKEALTIFEEALAYYETHENLQMTTHLSGDLVNYYRTVGNQEKELAYLEKCRSLNHILRDTFVEISFLVEETYAYQRLQQLDTAIATAQKSRILSEQINDTLMLSLSLFNIGFLSQFNGDYTAAVDNLLEAERLTFPRNYSTQRRQCFRHLAQSYARLEEYPTAYKYAIRYAILNDSILNQNRQKAINELTFQYETNEKRVAIDLLEKENALIETESQRRKLLLYGLTFGLFLLVILALIALRFYRQKIQNEQVINSQKEALHQQKIKQLENDLKINGMQFLLEGQEGERARIARELHDSVGGILSTIRLHFDEKPDVLNGTTAKVGNLIDEAAREVRSISRNLQPSALQQLGLIAALSDHINRLRSLTTTLEITFQHYDFPNVIDEKTSLQVFRIVQEALNNALKYAQATEILIQVYGQGNQLAILIEDDGVGFDLATVKRGNGLENQRIRAALLDGELSINSSKDGTEVFVLVSTGILEK
ncbi:MAG: two-component system NarL family sensor kinase [Paraglaciecola sp.]|jgi:two-component system NarL family sensor kinase